MINQELIDYIEKQLEKGVSKESLRNALIKSGWEMADIEEVFLILRTGEVPFDKSPEQSSQPKKVTVPGGEEQEKPSEFPVKAPLIQRPITVTDFDQEEELMLPKKRKGSKILRFSLTLLFIVFLGAAASWFYFYYFQSPDVMAQRMLYNLVKMQSIEYSGSFKIESKPDSLLNKNSIFYPKTNQDKITLVVTSDSMLDLSDVSNLRGEHSLSLSGNFLGDNNPSLSTEARTIGQNVYFKIKDPSNTRIDSINLIYFKNQWIKISFSELQQQIGLKNLLNQIKGEDQNADLLQTQADEIRQAVKQAKIFSITEVLPDEKSGDSTVYYYKFTINKDEIKNLLNEINTITLGSRMGKEQLGNIITLLDMLDYPSGEIWIDKNYLVPNQLVFESPMRQPDELEPSGNVKINLIFKSFNKGVQVGIPAPAKNYSDIYK